MQEGVAGLLLPDCRVSLAPSIGMGRSIIRKPSMMSLKLTSHVSAALSLRFPHILRWSLYMDECIEILEGSDEATPSDKILCQWVKLPRMADDLRARFDNRPKDSTSCLTDPEVQSDLRVFEHRLAEWEKELPKNISSGMLLGMTAYNAQGAFHKRTWKWY